VGVCKQRRADLVAIDEKQPNKKRKEKRKVMHVDFQRVFLSLRKENKIQK
jgi:hypothetical protein